MDTLFGDANIVFFTGAVLGRHAGRITEQFGIPSVVFHRNYEKWYYRDTDTHFLLKKVHMIVSDRQQQKSWRDAELSLVRTSFDLNKIRESFGKTKKYAALYGYHEAVDPTQIPHCLLYTSPSPRDATLSRMPSSA